MRHALSTALVAASASLIAAFGVTPASATPLPSDNGTPCSVESFAIEQLTSKRDFYAISWTRCAETTEVVTTATGYRSTPEGLVEIETKSNTVAVDDPSASFSSFVVFPSEGPEAPDRILATAEVVRADGSRVVIGTAEH